MEVVKPLLFRRPFPFEALSEGARWQAAQRRRLIGDEDDSHLGDFIEDKNAILPIDPAILSNLRETYTFERFPEFPTFPVCHGARGADLILQGPPPAAPSVIVDGVEATVSWAFDELKAV